MSCAVARGFQTPGPFDTGVKQNGNTLTPVSELFSDYQASGPAFDEMISDEGVRAAYSAALRQMGKLEADEDVAAGMRRVIEMLEPSGRARTMISSNAATSDSRPCVRTVYWNCCSGALGAPPI